MKTSCILEYIILVVFLVSCSEKDEKLIRNYDFELPEITGYYVVDRSGEQMGAVGTPNVRREAPKPETNAVTKKENELKGIESIIVSGIIRMAIYPNPAYNEFYVATSKKGKLWITRAKWYSEKDDMLNGGAVVFTDGSTKIMETDLKEFSGGIDVSFWPEGYYRVYVQTDNEILYDNLVVIHDRERFYEYFYN